VRIRERLDGGRTVSHHERIDELGVELSRIHAALAEDFIALERADDDGAPPSDNSVRAYFAYQRRPASLPG
jgi:hypothetical protein